MSKYASLFLLLIGGVWAHGSAAGQVLVQGHASRLDVATWNVEWFGSPTNGPADDDAQWQFVYDVLIGSDVDVWAFQEIADIARFTSLVDALGSPWSGLYATQSGNQRLAWIYRSDVLQDAIVSHVLTESAYSYAFASRPPLALSGTVTLADTSFSAAFINVHMKAFMDPSSWERRVLASSFLKDFVETTYPTDSNVLILGDFNDGVTTSYYSNYASPYVNFSWDTDRYLMLTSTLEEQSQFSYIGFSPGSNIDHMIATDNLGELYQDDARLYSSLLNEPQYIDRVSDHIPVLASFGASHATKVQEQPRHGPDSITLSAYPNPSTGPIHVSIEVSRPGPYEVDVFDGMGRRVKSTSLSLSYGMNTLDLINDRRLAAGIYFYRVSNSAGRLEVGSFTLQY